MNKEIWKPIKNYENSYEVSSHGRIRSLDRYVKTKNGKLRKEKSKIKKLKKLKDGYRINLYEDGIVKFYYVHRLVAEAFLENPENKEHVIHIDFNVHNNHYKNLKYATKNEVSEICQYSNKLSGKVYRKNNHRSVEIMIDNIYYPSISEAARKLNLDIQNISHALNKRYDHAYGMKIERVMKINDNLILSFY